MKKLFIASLILISGLSFSQIAVGTTEENNTRWTFGGGIGFGFGSNSMFNLQASPRVGYRLTDDLEAGVTGTVMWQTSDFYNSTMFGVGPFVNYYFARSFYVSGNLQHFFINYKDKYYDFKASDEETALYLGGGYLQRIGNNSFLQLGIMYNVLYKENNSIFANGLVPSIGFVVGL
ncbi:hypothetical protein IX39_01540 [Chryseobacterium formosense]|uniref:Outer membrane protein beta-barrel domain-containing protein n=1 Tax=Chryseobacterium formosense TaxID=236814 RepID=A0A085Z4L9_9FLAO|nr:hypothetical protein [Chryseobacterium formosense]KFE99382.1 hypothetical protein IX39_01540 [Chryseobacterium formosense]SFT53606.1 hypothetical protein SAMN05421857_1363 [Chryseobacterium formosense]